MICNNDYTLANECLEQLAGQGLEGLPDLVHILVIQAMHIEQENFLRAKPFERTQLRQRYANGYKPKTVKTRLWKVTFDIPQVREGDFYPSALEKGIRNERALLLTLAEMYVQGISTRSVAAITEQLCGIQISASQVSRTVQTMDEELQVWREGLLGKVVYLYLDARYEQVKRKLHGVQLIISDDHTGMVAARKSVFTGVPRQRCQFHLQNNAQSYVPKVNMRQEVAVSYLKKAVEKYALLRPGWRPGWRSTCRKGSRYLPFHGCSSDACVRRISSSGLARRSNAGPGL